MLAKLKPSVKLVWATPDGENLVSQMARVSSPKNEKNWESAPKLINYLIKHRHWSPFEMVGACVEISCTRDIARQILRHRSFYFQEFSQRYAEADRGYAQAETRLQDVKNRQNSLSLGETEDEQNLKDWWENRQAYLVEEIDRIYSVALKSGIAKEVARKILPEGITMSRMYMYGTLRSWLHYIQLRTGEETQKEHREVAEEIKIKLSDVFPTTFNVYFSYKLKYAAPSPR
jgi:thymidylate synthase (FAD)